VMAAEAGGHPLRRIPETCMSSQKAAISTDGSFESTVERS